MVVTRENRVATCSIHQTWQRYTWDMSGPACTTTNNHIVQSVVGTIYKCAVSPYRRIAVSQYWYVDYDNPLPRKDKRAWLRAPHGEDQKTRDGGTTDEPTGETASYRSDIIRSVVALVFQVPTDIRTTSPLFIRVSPPSCGARRVQGHPGFPLLPATSCLTSHISPQLHPSPTPEPLQLSATWLSRLFLGRPLLVIICNVLPFTTTASGSDLTQGVSVDFRLAECCGALNSAVRIQLLLFVSARP